MRVGLGLARRPPLLDRLVAIVLALVLTLNQRAVPIALRSLSFQPPSVAVLTNRVVSGDLSAAVRMRRGEQSLVVMAVTPLSSYWETLNVVDAPPLAQQLQLAGWISHGPPARFERLPPMVQPRPLRAPSFGR